MDDGFVDAVVIATGRTQRIPRHYLDHPTLSKPFRVLDTNEAPPEPAYPGGGPNDGWTVPQLRAWAADNGVSLGDATLKADIWQQIQASFVDVVDTTDPDGTEPSAETPPAGD